MTALRIGFAAATAALIASSAHAAEATKGYVHIGAAHLDIDPGGVVLSLAGTTVPGADFSVADDNVATAEVGLRIGGPWAVSLAVTSEADTKNTGQGSLSAITNIGSDSFVLGSATGHYHFDFGKFSPYVGGGVAYFKSTGTTNGALTNLDVADHTGGVLQLGADLNLSDNWGLFVDAKKYYVSIAATGNLGAAPVAARANLDPLQLGGGISYRF